jgi:hypothetical protein
MDDTPLAIDAMRERLGVQFDGIEIFSTPDGDRLGFYVAFIRGARIYFDHYGQPWMNTAEIARAFNLSPQNVHNAVTRIFASDLSELCGLNNLFTPNRRGEMREITLYDEETITAIATRANSRTPEAMEFLKERKWIIQSVRHLIIEYSTRADEQNARLRAALGEAELKAHHLTVDLEARMEQELRERYPEETF